MAAQSYRLFNVVLARKQVLSPSMLCCVFSGEDVRQMKLEAPDQRIKLLLPAPSGKQVESVDNGLTWWENIGRLAVEDRPIMRTYTLRHLNAEAEVPEMTVEFVMHGTEGPASAWALNAQPGDQMQIAAPNREYARDSGGYEWNPHPLVKQGLVVADETALPAAKAILEQLACWPYPPQLQVFLEVPERGDCIDLSHYDFAEIHWLPRDVRGDRHGEALLSAVRAHVRLPVSALSQNDLREEAEGQLVWDRADHEDVRFHGWVAAESSAVKPLRRYLIGERGLAQDCISFMAYWSRGPRRRG